MPTVCACGNERGSRPDGFLVIEKPCVCGSPGPGRVIERRKAPPVGGVGPKDPNRRRLGLPAYTDTEIGVGLKHRKEQ